MASKKKQTDAEFSSAYDNWNLEKLYSDLAAIKKKMLTPVEKSLLRGLLNGYSPAEIANIVYQSRNSSTVRVYLSNGLYKYIEELLSSCTGNSVKIQNWSRVAYLLEKAGYKKVTQPLTNRPLSADTAPAAWQQDWGEAIDVSVFYGRTRELRSLETWIVEDQCRLVAILGMGGIGKTALSVKIAEHVQDKFYVIWRSLAHAPPVTEILAQLIQFFAPNTNIPNNIHTSISQLIQYLRDRRCLLVLDNFEAVLTSEQSFAYREGYEGYAELIRRVGESSHQSCLVLTSREAPKEISTLQGVTSPVRALTLAGLSPLEAHSILHSKGLNNFSEEECKQLVDCYAGNPLFLKIIATIIQDLFASNISLFLEHNNIIFSNIREILNQQFHRLPELEKQVLYWLTLNPEQNLLAESQLEIVLNVSRAEILDAIAALQKRSLLDHNSITLHMIFVIYIVEHLSDQLIQKNKSDQTVTIFTKSSIESYLNNWIISKNMM